MKQFKVYWNNTVEINLVADFDTLDEAKQYCTDNTKGYDEIGDKDNCWEGRSNNFHYEVYDGEKEILDEDGDVVDFRAKAPAETSDSRIMLAVSQRVGCTQQNVRVILIKAGLITPKKRRAAVRK